MAAQSLTLSAWTARRLPDENVFDRTLRGDPVAFSEVYRRYQKRIYGYCLARSLDPDTAADATQEVFMKLLRAEPGSIDNPRAWLFTVARNVVIDVIRKRSRTPEDSGVEEESLAWDRLKSADTADEVLARSDARNVFLALRTIRPRYRTALIMREVHEQSAKDMAEALETTPGAVDTLVSRARDAFGTAYAAVGDLPSACRANVELIYRNLGTGITDQEQAALQAHITGCEHCRAEAKRAANPRHLAALLPFLVPVGRLSQGLLHRAALTARKFPDVAVQQVAPVLTQPHTWNLATKIAAGVLAATLVTAPIVATTVRTAAPSPARPAISSGNGWMSSYWATGRAGQWSSLQSGRMGAGMTGWFGWSPGRTWSSGSMNSMTGSPSAGWSGSWSGSGMSGSWWTAPQSTPKSAAGAKSGSSGSMSGGTSTGSGSRTMKKRSTSGSSSWSSGGGSMSSGSGSWSSGGGSPMGTGSSGW